MTHDYKRHGTTTLFAALSVLDGHVIGRCMQRPPPSRIYSLPQCCRAPSRGRSAIHVVLDNYATHKHPKVLAWLTRHPRWTFHFTPTSASWLNAVENFFSKMTRQRIRRGVFRSIAHLQAAINAYLAEHNASPKPFCLDQIRRGDYGQTRPLPCTIRFIQCTSTSNSLGARVHRSSSRSPALGRPRGTGGKRVRVVPMT